MKYLFSIVFSFSLLLSTTVPAQNQNKELMAKFLEIRMNMHQSGNPGFIIIDAVLEGVIDFHTPVVFKYTYQGISVNGTPLKRSKQKKFKEKMQVFYNGNGKNGALEWSYATPGLDYKDILDPTSALRTASFLKN